MKLTNNNLSNLIGSKFKQGRVYAEKGTWIKPIIAESDLDNLLYFYETGFRKGLIEPPEKTPHPLPYSTNKFSSKFFFKKYLKNKLKGSSIKKLLKNDFEMLYESGFIFPDYDSRHEYFYYNFKDYSFNANVRKYASFISFINKYSDNSKIKNICEIGGGYGGMAEMYILNHDVKNYLIIDLFGTLAIAITYLLNSRSLKNINFIYPESIDELKKNDFNSRNIIFIDYENYKKFTRDNLKDLLGIDLFINSNSFVEMPTSAVKDYFNFMEQFFDTYLFSSNAISREEGNEVVGANSFPYDNKWHHIHEVVVERFNDLSRLSKR